jgi:chemotaxis protein methyltransferase CheR
VKFHFGNLLDLPDGLLSELKDVDLIICRNVFIYFKPEAIAQVLATFARLLREGGYLMTGHGELHGHALGLKTFKTRLCEGSVIYQKIDPAACLPAPKATEVVRQPQAGAKSGPSASKPASRPRAAHPKPQSARKVAQAPAAAAAPKPPESRAPLNDLFSRGDYAAAIVLGENLLRQDPKNFEVLQLLAQAHANMGKHDQAAALCRQMLKIRTQATSPYFLLAHLAEAQGDRQEAKKLFKKVIYLDPGCVAAYFELTGLYAREHDQKRAETMRQTALGLLKSMAPDQRVEHYQKVTAGELVDLMGKVA